MHAALLALKTIRRPIAQENSSTLHAVAALSFATMLCVGVACTATATASSFRFEDAKSLDDMQTLLEKRAPIGSPRSLLERMFVKEGNATHRLHPYQVGVEKFIYDINLCRYYIWRWNISADFDKGGRLLQVYLNGNPVHKAGPQKKDVKALLSAGTKPAIFKAQRPRPEADRGETSLAYLLLDIDGNSKTIDDRFAVGVGPSRTDPENFGRMVSYVQVELWRSIFDEEQASQIVPYAGDCKGADAVNGVRH